MSNFLGLEVLLNIIIIIIIAYKKVNWYIIGILYSV